MHTAIPSSLSTGCLGTQPDRHAKNLIIEFKDAEKIEGVGDDNFLAPPGLHILKDGYYITISLGSMTRDREKLKAAGMKAVENLGKYTRNK